MDASLTLRKHIEYFPLSVHEKETLLAVAIEVRMHVFNCIGLLLPEIYLYRITYHGSQHLIVYSTSVYKLSLNFTCHVITAQGITPMRWTKFAYFPPAILHEATLMISRDFG